MARDHKHNNNIQRKNQNTKKGQKILLYVEGRNTEPSYFNLLKKNNCKITPVTKPGQGIGSCVSFVESANKKFNSLKKEERHSYKQKWVVFDYDGHNDFADGIKLARTYGFRTAFSNMCIEYWFLLHLINHDGSSIPLKGNSHSQAHIDIINDFIGKYNKKAIKKVIPYDCGSKTVEDDFFDLMMAINPATHNRRIEDACQQAYTIHQCKRKNGTEFSESVTTMYELLVELGTVKINDDGKFVLHE